MAYGKRRGSCRFLPASVGGKPTDGQEEKDAAAAESDISVYGNTIHGSVFRGEAGRFRRRGVYVSLRCKHERYQRPAQRLASALFCATSPPAIERRGPERLAANPEQRREFREGLQKESKRLRPRLRADELWSAKKDGLSDRETREVLIENIRYAAELGEAGIWLMVEPINHLDDARIRAEQLQPGPRFDRGDRLSQCHQF